MLGMSDTIIENTNEMSNLIKFREINPHTGISSGELVLKEPIGIEINDNGMAPQIIIGSKVNVQLKSKYNSGDIVCLPSDSGIIARQLIIHNDTYTFTSINTSKYPPIEKNIKDTIILGKVLRIITTLK